MSTDETNTRVDHPGGLEEAEPSTSLAVEEPAGATPAVRSGLTDSLKELPGLRLDFAEEYIDDAFRLTEILRPGCLVIVDLRDEFIDKDEALRLFVVLLQMFADTTYQGRQFNKFVVFDEAHKHIGSRPRCWPG